MESLEDESVNLVVTSPPYPLIEMWDPLFGQMNPSISKALTTGEGSEAFELSHLELDKVWDEVERVVKPGGFVCVNIGDATRSLNGQFQLYSNHTRITQAMIQRSFNSLPLIIWKKPTNSPTKFMGSGMLPAGAYVTLEHEYILIFRKGGKRVFKTPDDKANRNRSALFWEERNQWFSDQWVLKSLRQTLNHKQLRERSAAYTMELPYRLILMYSVYGDTVLDPFLGTGTTVLAAMATGRHSAGIELDSAFGDILTSDLKGFAEVANKRVTDRLQAHQIFMQEYTSRKSETKYVNHHLQTPVVTMQERELKLIKINKILPHQNLQQVEVGYEPI